MEENKKTCENYIEEILASKWIVVLYFLVATVSMILLARAQAFGDPPDEINRFKVAYYIANHGTLPNGYDEEIILGGYGGSYAFQPILSYIIMGYIMRFMMQFTQDAYSLLLAARMVNVVFGVIMAYYVWRIGKRLWEEVAIQWLFTLMIVFLPMNLFMHSYVNTDSMALLSVAMMVYSMLCGEEDDYGLGTCVRMGIGGILCIQSYYNAYGILVAAVIFFVYHFARQKKWSAMCKKGGLILGIALAGTAWWFIRNGILYQGDFLGMTARADCMAKTALPEYNPELRFSFYKAGLPISAVFAEKQYAWVTFESMIAMFGPMNIPTHGLIYLNYKRLVIGMGLAALIPLKKGQPKQWTRSLGHQKFTPRLCFASVMLLVCFITMGLHLYYSYTWEYQPQGRYLLPMVVSAAYLLVMGIWKFCQLLDLKWGKKSWYVQFGVVLLIVMFIGATYAYTIFIKVLPVYVGENSLSALKGVHHTELIDMFFGRI